MFASEVIHVYRPDGAVDTALTPFDTEDLVDEHRSVMHKPGIGTWFTAEWTLARGASGSVPVEVAFNYDEEPDWEHPISPASYAIEPELDLFGLNSGVLKV